MNRARFLPGLVAVVAACSIGQPGRERLGDDAWHEGRWSDAVAAYAAAGTSPRLLAKLADAALQGGMLVQSAQAWTTLGIDDTTRAGEAATGLVRVADAAQQAGNEPALQQAILGLRKVAPAWPLGRLATRAGRLSGLPAADVAQVIPALLSSANGRVAGDPLVLDLGVADRVRGACGEAVPILEAVLRRNENAALRDSAATTLGWCELGLGLQALDAARLDDAERWLDRAAHRDPQGAVGRRALVAFGDARARLGDSVAARESWQAAASHEPPDSIAQLALGRLVQVTPRLAGDTATQVRP